MICSYQGTNEPLGLVAARLVDTDPTHTAYRATGVWSPRSQPSPLTQEQPAPTAGSGPGRLVLPAFLRSTFECTVAMRASVWSPETQKPRQGGELNFES